MPTNESLLAAMVSLNAELSLPSILDTFLQASNDLTGAPYAALNIVDHEGHSLEFHYTGMAEGVWAQIGRAPNAVGTLGLIPEEGLLVIDELTRHPAFRGLPKGHPPLGSFLGTSLQVRGKVFGQLYLANKEGGFTERDGAIVQALAAAASIAIDHAQLYAQALAREQWLTASQDITTKLLTDPGDEDAFSSIVDAAMRLSRAEHAALVFPGMGDTWVMEFTAGPHAQEMLGLVLPEDGYAITTIRSGVGTIALEPPGGTVLDVVRDFGPTLYAPLKAEGHVVGLLMLWRDKGHTPFNEEDLAIAQRFASQAAVALTIAELTHVKNMTTLLEERQRLADDLHDFVSQELFATAMQIEAAADDADPGMSARLRRTLDHVKRAQREVRGVMSSLAGQRTSEPLSERVRRELVMARDSLGFDPSVRVDWSEVAHAVAGDPTLSDDVVAVMRELLSNVARHAHASVVHVAIEGKDGRLSIMIADDGVGPAGATRRHSGTSNLANRALRRNGTFTLAPSRPGAVRPGTVAEWNVEASG